MKKVLFLTKCRFPYGDASSKRNMIFCNYFIDRSFSPFLIGMGDTEYKKEIYKDGANIVSLRKYKKPKNVIQKILNHLFSSKRIIDYAIKYHNDADVIIVDPRLYKIFRAKKASFKKAIIIYTVVEFYSPSEYKFNGFFSKSYRDNYYFNTHLKPTDGKVIAISNYLKNHFLSKGIQTIRVPFVVDNTKTSIVQTSKQKTDNKIRFIYCGNPRSKDKLIDILLAFCLLPNRLIEKTEIHIFGVSDKWLSEQRIKEENKKTISLFTIFHGYQKYEDVIGYYKNCDFSLLLRPSSERYAMAGFPTKITESLEFGIPPITNFTSDLGIYLKDMINSIQVNGDDIDSFKEALIKAFSLKEEKINEMKTAAKKASVDELDIRCFYKDFDTIVGQ